MENGERLSRAQNQPVPDDSNAKQLAALSYVWIFSLLILLARRENGFIQHHARRGIVLFALSLLFWWIPFLHYGEILILAIAVMGFIQASMGNEFRLPLLSEIADGTLRRREIQGYADQAKREAGKMAQSVSELGPSAADEASAKIEGLANRVADDEGELHRLEEEVHQLEAEIHKTNS